MLRWALLLLSGLLLGCEPTTQSVVQPEPPQTRTTIVALHAPWCGACKTMYPRWNTLERRGHKVERYNVDDGNPWDARAVPCTIIYKDGVEKHRFYGTPTVAEIERLL